MYYGKSELSVSNDLTLLLTQLFLKKDVSCSHQYIDEKSEYISTLTQSVLINRGQVIRFTHKAGFVYFLLPGLHVNKSCIATSELSHM